MTHITDEQRIEDIRAVVRAEGQAIRERFPILANNNVMGMGIFLFAIAGVLLTGWAYLEGMIAAYVSIPLVAIFTSLLHELEHDLIHWMYFKKTRWVHHTMLLVSWMFRPGTLNPWIRRKLHFLHHKTSGTEDDIEERGIGNGRRYGLLRLLIMMDTFGGNLIATLVETPWKQKPKRFIRIILANMPFGVATGVIWYSFLGFHCLNLLTDGIVWSEATMAWMNNVQPLVVILIAPFYLRSFCLNFISSNMHYYGNVDSVIKQCQVLNHPLFLPFQLFCFNFGSTHGIHHFVVAEPFYIRQLTAKKAHEVMKKHGVRFNDFSTFKDANKYDLNKDAALTESMA